MEERLKSVVPSLEKMSNVDIKRLIHELEMQNEELRKTQIEIEESHQKYTDLYDYAPVGYFTVDENGLIIGANLKCATMLGVERSFLIKKSLSLFITREDQDKYYLYRHHVFEMKEHKVCELKMVKKDRTKFYAQLECAVAQDIDGSSKKCMIAIIDITERKKAEGELHQYEHIISSSTDMLAIMDKKFIYVAANPAYLGGI